MSTPLTPEQIEAIKAKAQALSQQLADAAMQLAQKAAQTRPQPGQKVH
jgi:hypothetical protein